MDGYLACAIAFLFIVLVLVLILLFYIPKIRAVNKYYCAISNRNFEICLRKFPFPYKAALAICSDIDRTRTAEHFIKIQRFLNTKDMTEMGRGVGLEIGNSFFMFASKKNRFSYFSTRPIDKVIIKRFIDAGYLDVIHSWGEGFKDRQDAIDAVRELESNNLRVKVWVNHATVKNNLGFSFPNFSLDKGDNKETKFYHADITIPYGIKFVWTGASTWVIGQDTTLNLNTFTGSFDSLYPLKSIVNISKALLKHLFGIVGILSSRYDMHAYNELVKPYILDDKQKVYQFMRYDNHFNGIGKGAVANTMHYNLSPRFIRHLKSVGGYAILYTHFGINYDCANVICEETQSALRYLENEYRTGQVYVTTTSKLLTYYINHKFLNWNYEICGDELVIRILGVNDPVFGMYIPDKYDLQGITFYVPVGRKAKIFIGTTEVPDIVRNPMDETDRESITVPHKYLVFPDVNDLELDL